MLLLKLELLFRQELEVMRLVEPLFEFVIVGYFNFFLA